MIDLYTWTTPNGRKISVMLEECGLPYRVHPIDLSKGEQHDPRYAAIHPIGKIPAIVDHDGPTGEPYTLFESGAILLYLADKTGRFLPRDPAAKHQVLQWLMFQMGGLGPVLGEVRYFLHIAPAPIPAAIERATKERDRYYAALDRHLAHTTFLAGEYSVADIACYPWIARYQYHQVAIDNYPHVQRWYETIRARPGVQKGMLIPPEPNR